MRKIKVLLVGDDSYEMYVKAFYRCFRENSEYNVELFATNRYMQSSNYFEKSVKRIENNLATGYSVYRLNNLLLQNVKKNCPDLVFLYSARLILASTIKKLKELNITVFCYNNDDPFADYYPKYFWRHYRAGLKYVDQAFVYRIKNIVDCQKSGCNKVEMLRAYYIKERNYPINDNDLILDMPEVMFLGHNENDERQEYIKALLEKKIRVGVARKTWEEFEEGNPYLKKLDNTHDKYNEMLNSCKIAIVFLSKINNDTYTRRCFEIPAVKTMMLSVYTDDIVSMFEPNKEAAYFKSKEDFVNQIQYYLEHEDERISIANAGYERLMKDGHEVKDRVKQVMYAYKKIREEC